MSAENWIAVGSAVIALLSLLASAVVVRRQIRLQTEEIRAALDAETSRWASEVLACFEQILARLSADPRDAEPQGLTSPVLVAERLSSMADLGRLYFPNFAPDAHGVDNPAAFRGWRQPAIDATLIAYEIARNLPRMSDAQRQSLTPVLFQARRTLISEVQIARDPRRLEILIPAAKRAQADVSADKTRNIWGLVEEMRRHGLPAHVFTQSMSPSDPRAKTKT